MITLLVLLLLIAAGLEWNRRHQAGPADRGGSRPDVPDRDRQRLLEDLRAAADRSCANW